MMFLDIRKYFNHKMLLEKDEKHIDILDENYGICGNFITSQDLCFGLNIDESYYFDFEFDNIICNEQEILIGYNCRNIVLFGFAEWGSFEENVIIKTDKLTYTEKIFFYEWHTIPQNIWRYEKRQNDCQLVFKTKTNLLEHVCMYKYEIELKDHNYISRIMLPKNPAIHIFAIIAS